MSTHAIGTGKVNVTTTFDQVDARRLGRAAFVSGKSRNEWVREVVMQAVRRAEYLRHAGIAAAKVTMLILSFGAIGLAIFGGEDMRRAPRPLRVNRRWEDCAA